MAGGGADGGSSDADTRSASASGRPRGGTWLPSPPPPPASSAGGSLPSDVWGVRQSWPPAGPAARHSPADPGVALYTGSLGYRPPGWASRAHSAAASTVSSSVRSLPPRGASSARSVDRMSAAGGGVAATAAGVAAIHRSGGSSQQSNATPMFSSTTGEWGRWYGSWAVWFKRRIARGNAWHSGGSRLTRRGEAAWVLRRHAIIARGARDRLDGGAADVATGGEGGGGGRRHVPHAGEGDAHFTVRCAAAHAGPSAKRVHYCPADLTAAGIRHPTRRHRRRRRRHRYAVVRVHYGTVAVSHKLGRARRRIIRVARLGAQRPGRTPYTHTAPYRGRGAAGATASAPVPPHHVRERHRAAQVDAALRRAGAGAHTPPRRVKCRGARALAMCVCCVLLPSCRRIDLARSP